MGRCYGRFCPISHALDLVGERWALLVVAELSTGPQRYSDLAATLGVGTNILAARLRELESAGIVEKHRLPPPAASQVYELTERGRGLTSVLRELAHWGARSLGPPTPDDHLEPGWLYGALCTSAWATDAPGSVEFRVGPEVAALVDGEAVVGRADDPDAVVTGSPAGFYHLFVDRDFEGVSIQGDRDAVGRVLDAVWPVPEPSSAV